MTQRLLCTLVAALCRIASASAHSHACTSLLAPQNGDMSCSIGFEDGSVCTFICDVGYSIIGPLSAACNAGIWSDFEPFCTPVTTTTPMVTTTTIPDGTIRIQSGTAQMGRIEIYHAGVWGSICHDGFTDQSATVACNQLGLGTVGLAFKGAHFGSSASAVVWLSEVACDGSEIDIMSCPNSGWLNHVCTPLMDAGIQCLNAYSYRLVDGPTPNAGRVEIQGDGVWMGVCDSGFDLNAANVTCNYLGYSGALSFHPGGQFGEGTGVARYAHVTCLGDENNLAECQHVVGGIGTCSGNDVGVTCRGGDIRLVTNAYYSHGGTIEIFHAGQWGSIDPYGIDDTTAKVVCNILGFGYIGSSLPYGFYHDQHSVPWILYNMACLGNETNLVECPHSGWISTGSYYSGAGVYCGPYDLTDIRLVGGSVPYEGRVEILVDGIWGTVCDDGWGINDAHVICRMLGFSEAENYYQQAHFGEGTGAIMADDVHCLGNETHLTNCSITRALGNNCVHSEDSSVRCKVVPRCFQQWMAPVITKFVMQKTEISQTNYTIIQTTPTTSQISCVRECSVQAREECGMPDECFLVKYNVTTNNCTLFRRINMTSPVTCDQVTPCFKSIISG